MNWTKISAIEPGDEVINIIAKVYLTLFRSFQLRLSAEKPEWFWETRLLL